VGALETKRAGVDDEIVWSWSPTLDQVCRW